MRAHEPDGEGYVDLDGVKLHYEVFGDGAPTLLLLPAWTIAQSRCWKAQVKYLAHHFRVASQPDEATIRRWCARVRSPVLVAHGDKDRICPLRSGEALARATGGSLVVLGGAGHLPPARDPVKVNLLIREFAAYLPARGAP